MNASTDYHLIGMLQNVFMFTMLGVVTSTCISLNLYVQRIYKLEKGFWPRFNEAVAYFTSVAVIGFVDLYIVTNCLYKENNPSRLEIILWFLGIIVPFVLAVRFKFIRR